MKNKILSALIAILALSSCTAADNDAACWVWQEHRNKEYRPLPMP